MSHAPAVTARRAGDRARVVDALTVPDLATVVDLVVWVEEVHGERVAHAANHGGRVRLRPGGRHELLSGTDPVASEDPLACLPYAVELAHPSPRTSVENAYPEAAERLLSLFADATRSPDLVVVHTPRHYFPEEGGHLGEHGSLDVIQSRAPLVLSGAGVLRRGVVAQHARLVDVGPTMAALAGVAPEDLTDADGAALDGRVLTAYLEGGGAPRRVVGVLWDGAPCGDLLHLAEAGELPAVARLVEGGVALRGGALAQFPSVTLTNHTSILTGLGPGRHGVLGNVFFDRQTGERVVPNDETTWHRSAQWLRPAVRTVFEMVNAVVPGGDGPGDPRTASVNEAIDRGADYSTMQLVRASGSERGAGGLGDRLPDPHASAFVTDPSVLLDPSVRWGVQVDDLGLDQVMRLWENPARAPRLTWWANVVTDAGHHAAGPRSALARATLRQSDARLGVFLDHLGRVGALDEVAVVLTADHGFEGADPTVTGSWRGALDDLGLAYRDEGPGFVYLL